jgi:hypothetical protein
VAPRRRRAFRSLVDAGVVVALFGLIFGVTTYWADQREQEREDERQARAALTDITGQLTALPRVYAQQLASSSGSAQSDLSANLNTETVVLVAQAERLATDNPSIVRATDFYTIGEAYSRLLDFDRAYERFAAAAELASTEGDFTIASASQRGMAGSLFGLGRADEGRELFGSITSAEGFDALSDSEQLNNAWFTLMIWIRTEASYGYCDYAHLGLADLAEVATAAGSAPATFDQVAAVEQSVRAVCGPG